jgi:hypothetical protein
MGIKKILALIYTFVKHENRSLSVPCMFAGAVSGAQRAEVN